MSTTQIAGTRYWLTQTTTRMGDKVAYLEAPKFGQVSVTGLATEQIAAKAAELDATYDARVAELEARLAQREQAPAAPATPAEPMATERQISYALGLAAKNASGSLTISRAYVASLTRAQASQLIDSLKVEW